MRLRGSDWNRLVNAIAELNSDSDPRTLPERAIKTANYLISGEITAFDFFNSDGVHTGKNWYDPPDAISKAENEILVNVVHGHPISPEIFCKKRRKALTISDLLTTPQFHRTAIYNEFYRIYRIDHQLMAPLQISDDTIVTYTYNRVGRDFSVEERLMIDLFAPHVANAIRNGQMVERLTATESRLNSVLSNRAIGVVSVDDTGKMIYLSGHAEVLLHKYYGNNPKTPDEIPRKLFNWLASCDAQREVDPMISEFKLKLEKNDSALSLTIIFNDSIKEKMVLLEETRLPSPLSLFSLGLTRRQTEILFWVSQGKTDKDIGQLLGISPRTVHKHLENIYIALGVETRVAAIMRAVERYNASN